MIDFERLQEINSLLTLMEEVDRPAISRAEKKVQSKQKVLEETRKAFAEKEDRVRLLLLECSEEERLIAIAQSTTCVKLLDEIEKEG